MQLARRSQNTLTSWTHFQKEPHQPSSLPEEARTHSLAGHIFRRSPISRAACQNTLTSWTHFQKEPHHAACQKKPEHTHFLDTFSEGAQSAMQLARRSHSQPGHIFRRSPISHAACQKKPEHTHCLDTVSEGPQSAIQLARRSQNTLTTWTHFQKEPNQPCSLPEEARTHSLPGHSFRRSPISHAACQKKPEDTHFLDTFSEGASSTMQLARRSQNTLTYWTHFQKQPHQPSSLPEEARTHSLPGHILRRSLISHAAFQKKPEHTHFLDTSGPSSAMQLARRSQNTLTFWTHFQKVLLGTWPGNFEIHSQSEQFLRTLIEHLPFFKRIKYTYLKSLFCDLLSLV